MKQISMRYVDRKYKLSKIDIRFLHELKPKHVWISETKLEYDRIVYILRHSNRFLYNTVFYSHDISNVVDGQLNVWAYLPKHEYRVVLFYFGSKEHIFDNFSDILEETILQIA